MGQAIVAEWGQQRDAMPRVGHVQVDAGDVGEIVSVLVALEDEVRAVVVTRCRAAQAVVEHQEQVLVRLCLGRLYELWRKVVQETEVGDHPRWILKRIEAVDYGLEFELWGDERWRMCNSFPRVGDRTGDRTNTALRKSGAGKYEEEAGT